MARAKRTPTPPPDTAAEPGVPQPPNPAYPGTEPAPGGNAEPDPGAPHGGLSAHADHTGLVRVRVLVSHNGLRAGGSAVLPAGERTEQLVLKGYIAVDGADQTQGRPVVA